MEGYSSNLVYINTVDYTTSYMLISDVADILIHTERQGLYDPAFLHIHTPIEVRLGYSRPRKSLHITTNEELHVP